MGFSIYIPGKQRTQRKHQYTYEINSKSSWPGILRLRTSLGHPRHPVMTSGRLEEARKQNPDQQQHGAPCPAATAQMDGGGAWVGSHCAVLCALVYHRADGVSGTCPPLCPEPLSRELAAQSLEGWCVPRRVPPSLVAAHAHTETFQERKQVRAWAQPPACLQDQGRPHPTKPCRPQLPRSALQSSIQIPRPGEPRV